MKKRESNGKVVALRGDRNLEVVKRRIHRQAAATLGSLVAPYGWQPLQPVAVPEGAVYAAENARCAVVGWQVPNPFAPPGQQDVYPMMHLAVSERGRPLIWEEMMTVVREACGPQAEAVELYPALRRELRGERNRHLYAFVHGEEWPIGTIPEGEALRRQREHEVAQKVGEFLQDKTIVFVAPGAAGDPFRIFRDVADAVAAGVEGASLREQVVGAVPDGPGFEWSAAATAYRDEIEKQASELRDRLLCEQRAAVAEEAAISPIMRAPASSAPEDTAAEAAAAADLAALRQEMVRKD